MPETETTMDELLVAESVQSRSATQDGLIAAISLVVILAIAITTTAVLFFPVLQGAMAFWFSWVFSTWGY